MQTFESLENISMASISFNVPPTTQFGTLEEVLRRIGVASVTFNFPPSMTAPTELLSAAEPETPEASGTLEELPLEEPKEISPAPTEAEMNALAEQLEEFHLPPPPPPLLVQWEQEYQQQEHNRFYNQELLCQSFWAAPLQTRYYEEGLGPMEIEEEE